MVEERKEPPAQVDRNAEGKENNTAESRKGVRDCTTRRGRQPASLQIVCHTATAAPNLSFIRAVRAVRWPHQPEANFFENHDETTAWRACGKRRMGVRGISACFLCCRVPPALNCPPRAR